MLVRLDATSLHHHHVQSRLPMRKRTTLLPLPYRLMSMDESLRTIRTLVGSPFSSNRTTGGRPLGAEGGGERDEQEGADDDDESDGEGIMIDRGDGVSIILEGGVRGGREGGSILESAESELTLTRSVQTKRGGGSGGGG